VPAVMPVVVVPVVMERAGLAELVLPRLPGAGSGSGSTRAGHGRRRDGEHSDDQGGHRRDALHAYSSAQLVPGDGRYATGE
jgi:hypothetical protein